MSDTINPQIPQKSKSNGILILILLLLMGGLGVMAYKYSGRGKELEECANSKLVLQTDMDQMNKMMAGYVDNMSNDLNKDFSEMLRGYDELIAKDATKADSLNLQKGKIKELQSRLETEKRAGRLSAQTLIQLRRENETLRGIMKGYVIQIDSLNQRNYKLATDLDNTATELKTTTEERDVLKTDVEQKDVELKKGARIAAYAFSSSGLREKLNRTTEPTSKARNCIQMKSTFTVGENAIAKPGEKIVYMQIINPDGKTMGNKTTTVDGESVPYSDSRKIDYANSAVDVTIFYDLNGEEPVKGNYTVKIYIDGQLAGKDNFTLK
jgi:hypothetical protein